MSVLVDSSVWSLALRRRRPVGTDEVAVLRELIEKGQVQIIGPIRQEILSGIREKAQFLKLKHALSAFPDLELSSSDHETAAEFCNTCMAAGIQASHTDFLIAAVAFRRRLSILSVDKDFQHLARILPIRRIGVK